MELRDYIHQHFGNNVHIHRSLIEGDTDGTLSCGYVSKNRQQGSHINISFDFYSALLILSGEGFYDDGIHAIPLKAGDLVQRLPNHQHTTLVTSDDWEEIYICLGTPLFHTLVGLHIFSLDTPVLHPGLEFSLVEQHLKIYRNLHSSSPSDLPTLVPMILEFLISAYAFDRSHTTNLSFQERLAPSLDYIQRHLTDRDAIRGAAASINMGYEKYRKLFQSHYGTAPGNYLIHRRILLAQDLLSGTDMTIKEIAFQLGYPDAYTFSKQFKKINGLAPQTFRQYFSRGNGYVPVE